MRLVRVLFVLALLLPLGLFAVGCGSTPTTKNDKMGDKMDNKMDNPGGKMGDNKGGKMDGTKSDKMEGK
jgi:hypothetical protein